MNNSLVLTESMHQILYAHLYPGDQKEAIAICLCGRHQHSEFLKIMVFKVRPIPYEDCDRDGDLLKWSTKELVPLLEEASKKNMAILKIHSHPGGYDRFSETDDRSDLELFESVFGWTDFPEPHGSAVMLPDGKIFGRIITNDLRFEPFSKVIVIGDDITVWDNPRTKISKNLQLRNIQAFGEGTVRILNGLTIGVLGCSGTGSVVIEQLARLGAGRLILADPDKIEEKNVNRILNSGKLQAEKGLFKVDILKTAIERMGFATEVYAIAANIYNDLETIHTFAACDIIFGCIDSVDGRHMLNQIASFYCIPYFDVGVKLVADGKGNVDQICGSLHYLQPGGSSLMTRNVYTFDDLKAASLFRKNQVEYENLKKSGYIANVNVDRPAVISVNMLVASLAVNELLARIHKYRTEPNNGYAITRFSLTDGYFQFESDGEKDVYLEKFVGRGDLKPLLNMPEVC